MALRNSLRFRKLTWICLVICSSPFKFIFFRFILKSFLASSPPPRASYKIFHLFWKKHSDLELFFPIFVKFSFFYKNFCLWIRLNQLIEYKYQILVLWYFVHFLGHHSSKFFNYLNYRCFLLYIAWISLLHCKKNICNIKLKMKNKD